MVQLAIFHGSRSAQALGTLAGTALLLGGLGLTPAMGLEPDYAGPDTTTDIPAAENDPRFTCERVNGEYVVMYNPKSQPDESYAWAQPSELGGGWTPERRCEAIANRLESYRPDGMLELLTAVENGYDTVCVTTEAMPECRIVLTVPPGQDPELVRDRVFDNLVTADSGQNTDAVNTLVGGDSNIVEDILNGLGGRSRQQGINLRPFLDPTDGGTGVRLTGGSYSGGSNGGSSGSGGRRLNPDNF